MWIAVCTWPALSLRAYLQRQASHPALQNLKDAIHCANANHHSRRCSAATSLATASTGAVLLPSQMSQIAGHAVLLSVWLVPTFCSCGQHAMPDLCFPKAYETPVLIQFFLQLSAVHQYSSTDAFSVEVSCFACMGIRPSMENITVVCVCPCVRTQATWVMHKKREENKANTAFFSVGRGKAMTRTKEIGWPHYCQRLCQYR